MYQITWPIDKAEGYKYTDMSFIKKLKELIQRIKHRISCDYCYTEMENRGIAVFGCCSGLTGGDELSGYLQCGCVKCPYFVEVSKISLR